MPRQEWIEIGWIARPRGLKGEVWVDPISDDPERLSALDHFRVELNGRQEQIRPARVAVQNGRLVFLFKGHESRDAAEALCKRYLFIHKSQLPPLEEGEVFLQDLLDLEVRLEDDCVLGRVQDTPEMPTGVMLDVRQGEFETLIPFNRHFVTELDLEAGWLRVKLMDGLVAKEMLAAARAGCKGAGDVD